jgi:EmrB/QacA subfamily drug resistance transporter
MTDRRSRAIALLVAGTFFMEILDGTILTTAAPSIGRALGVPSVAVGVTITAYLLTLAVLIPLSGWIAKRFGARRVFLAAIAIFTIASILCASSTSLLELTAMRVLQGVGGAMMVPVGRLAVLRVAEKADIVRAIALLTWPALAAPVIAPLAGGIITTYASWQWIFLINVPLGAMAFIAALRLFPRERSELPQRLDVLGLLLSCSGLGLLVYVGAMLAEAETDWVLVGVLAAAGLSLVTLAILHFRRTAHPLLDLTALKIETFRVAHAGGSVFRLTISAVPFLLPLLFQDVFGWSPVVSGLMVLVLFLGNIAIKPTTTAMLRRFGFRPVLIVTTLGAAASMALSALLTPATPVALVVLLMFFSGVVRSIGFTGYNTIAFADVGRVGMTDANTLASTVQQVAAGFGVAVGAVALRLGGTFSGTESLTAFRFSFAVLAVLTLISSVEAIRLTRTAGETIRPARRT